MENLLFYIFLGISIALLVWVRIKGRESYKEINEQIKNMSLALLSQKRAKMIPKDYIRWLRKLHTLAWTIVWELKDKKRKIDPRLINALILMEKEIEDINLRMGTQINLGRKASDEFKELN